MRCYHVDPDHKERGFLTENEIQALGTIKLDNPNFALTRDLFLFGCWTGISFTDIKNLTTDNIVEMNGTPWIVSKRQKTGVLFQIKLMDIPMQIIRRYEPFRTDKRLFNIGSLDMVNKRIKAVAKKCGIEKPISFHLSRHSFAVLIKLRYADRKREQDFGTYQYHHHADLRESDQHET